jgi:hypothetical protein
MRGKKESLKKKGFFPQVEVEIVFHIFACAHTLKKEETREKNFINNEKKNISYMEIAHHELHQIRVFPLRRRRHWNRLRLRIRLSYPSRLGLD